LNEVSNGNIDDAASDSNSDDEPASKKKVVRFEKDSSAQYDELDELYEGSSDDEESDKAYDEFELSDTDSEDSGVGKRKSVKKSTEVKIRLIL
jgi:hypothetical protein